MKIRRNDGPARSPPAKPLRSLIGTMRPHQECLLLASGFNRAPPNAPPPDSADQAQVAQLRDFVRAMLGRRSPAGAALRDVDLFGHPGGVAIPPKRHDAERAALPAEPAQAMIAFDIAALLHAPHLRKYAVLPPLALARDMALIAAGADPLPVLAMLQDVLRHAHAVTVFGDGGAGRDLALLGASRIAVLPLPALARQSADADRVVVQLFDHEPARGRMAAVAGAVAEALPAARVVTDAAPFCAGLHLHLGVGPGDAMSLAGPWRIVDSFAARCPVVHLRDGPLRAAPAEHSGMAVEPMRSGILAGTVAEAAAGLVRLAADAALVDVFRRHAGHAAETFNRRIEDRLREMSP